MRDAISALSQGEVPCSKKCVNSCSAPRSDTQEAVLGNFPDHSRLETLQIKSLKSGSAKFFSAATTSSGRRRSLTDPYRPPLRPCRSQHGVAYSTVIERDPYAHWKQRSANHVVGEEPVRGAEGAERRHPSRLSLASEAAIRAWAPFPIASHFGTPRVEFELRRRRAAPPTIDTN